MKLLRPLNPDGINEVPSNLEREIMMPKMKGKRKNIMKLIR
jgi:hypothetical protein